MQWSTPTTQTELHNALKDIFYYYRVRRAEFEDVNLSPLSLARLNFAKLSTHELLTQAQTLNASKQHEFREKYFSDINKELAIITAKLDNLDNVKISKIDKVNADFDNSVAKLTTSLAQNGLGGSSIAVDKLAQLEVERNKLLAEIESDYQTESVVLTAEKNNLLSDLQSADDFCTQKENFEQQEKYIELVNEQDKLQREVFKYNNGLDEKEQRYANSIKEVSATLELRFLDIQSGEFTKEQLIDMGYYQDVIDCVCAYYDTLPTLTAAQQIVKDKNIIIYLEDFYDSIIYLYQQRALV